LGEWTKIYSLPFKVTLDTKLRAFQYRFLNHILYANDELFAFKIADSLYCTFCKNEVESPEHLFFFCKVVDMFWKEVLSWIALYSNEVMDISFSDVFFGKFNVNKDFMIISRILLLAKFFIYRCKLAKKKPSLDVFKAKLKATYKLEPYVARKNDVLSRHYVKWDAFISILSKSLFPIHYLVNTILPLNTQYTQYLNIDRYFLNFCIAYFSILAFYSFLIQCKYFNSLCLFLLYMKLIKL